MPAVHVVNLQGVKTSLDLIPDATYPARFTGKRFGVSKTQNPKVTMEFVFTEEAGEGIAQRKAYVECSLQPQALFKIKRVLIDMGADPTDLETQVDLDEVLGDLIGTDCAIKVGHHEFNGADHNDFYVVPTDTWSSS